MLRPLCCEYLFCTLFRVLAVHPVHAPPPYRYGPTPNNGDSAINVLVDIVSDQSGKTYNMDHYATRYPTNVLDIADFLVRLTCRSSLNFVHQYGILICRSSPSAQASSSYSALLCRRTLHEVRNMPRLRKAPRAPAHAHNPTARRAQGLS